MGSAWKMKILDKLMKTKSRIYIVANFITFIFSYSTVLEYFFRWKKATDFLFYVMLTLSKAIPMCSSFFFKTEFLRRWRAYIFSYVAHTPHIKFLVLEIKIERDLYFLKAQNLEISLFGLPLPLLSLAKSKCSLHK